VFEQAVFFLKILFHFFDEDTGDIDVAVTKGIFTGGHLFCVRNSCILSGFFVILKRLWIF